jgi:hypothetical protein
MAQQVGPVPGKADNFSGQQAAGSIGTRHADSMKARSKPPKRPDIRLQPILKRPIEEIPLANREESI